MFLRKHRRKKDGKEHIYWSLRETIRTPKGPRQRLISYMGELNPEEQAGYKGLAKQLEGKDTRQMDLLHPAVYEKNISVYPDRIQVERVRDFGDAWAGVGMWKLLKLDHFFKNQMVDGREDIRWESVICFLVVSRLCRSMSKLGLVERYVDQSALSDILGIDSFKINKNRLYRAMDVLLECKQKLCYHLKERYGELFHLDYDLLLYDITSTYFEGQCLRNPQAKRGHSRDKRSDCKQVTLALIVTREGLPLYYEVFDGNRRDVTTVEDIVEAVESIYGRANRIWAMDRGMVSEKNLEWLRQRESLYIVGTPKSMIKEFSRELLEKEWQEIYSDLEVKKVLFSDYQNETFVLCRSASRREKEKAIVDFFAGRIEAGLEKLKQAVERKKRALRNQSELERKIGALLKVNSRTARMFEIKVDRFAEGKKTRLSLNWKRKTSNQDWVDATSGCYLLRTNLSKELSAKEVWKAYIGLTQVEEAFRITKQDLGIRPVYHQKEKRVQAHILICFLSLCLQRTMEQGLIAKGLGRSTRKVLEELRGLKSMDLILPLTTGAELRLRIISNPDPALKILLDYLNLKTPKRLLASQNVVTQLGPPLIKNQALTPLLCA